MTPLRPASIAALYSIRREPCPRQDVNSGIARRLEGGGLVEVVQMQSPFPTHKGRKIDFLRITDAGRQALADLVVTGTPRLTATGRHTLGLPIKRPPRPRDPT